jgi:hypothetical protein
MGKKGGTQSVTTGPDEMTRRYLQELYGAASNAGRAPGAGPSSMSTGAADFFKTAQNAGNLGFGALSGDPTAVNQLMNPFTGGVLEQIKSQFGDLSGMARRGTNEAATRAGAFGGSRHGVAQGVAQGEVQKHTQGQIASLLQGEYTGAMDRANSLANFGMGGADRGFAAGEYFRNLQEQNDPSMRHARVLRDMYIPTGGGVTSQPTNRNAGAGFLGGAATGAGIGSQFGPWGTGIGAGLGGLIGLFG